MMHMPLNCKNKIRKNFKILLIAIKAFNKKYYPIETKVPIYFCFYNNGIENAYYNY